MLWFASVLIFLVPLSWLTNSDSFCSCYFNRCIYFYHWCSVFLLLRPPLLPPTFAHLSHSLFCADSFSAAAFPMLSFAFQFSIYFQLHLINFFLSLTSFLFLFVVAFFLSFIFVRSGVFPIYNCTGDFYICICIGTQSFFLSRIGTRKSSVFLYLVSLYFCKACMDFVSVFSCSHSFWFFFDSKLKIWLFREKKKHTHTHNKRNAHSHVAIRCWSRSGDHTHN